MTRNCNARRLLAETLTLRNVVRPGSSTNPKASVVHLCTREMVVPYSLRCNLRRSYNVRTSLLDSTRPLTTGTMVRTLRSNHRHSKPKCVSHPAFTHAKDLPKVHLDHPASPHHNKCSRLGSPCLVVAGQEVEASCRHLRPLQMPCYQADMDQDLAEACLHLAFSVAPQDHPFLACLRWDLAP